MGERRRGGARGHVELRVDVADVAIDGSFADPQGLRDLAVRAAAGEVPEDLGLACAEAARDRRCGARERIDAPDVGRRSELDEGVPSGGSSSSAAVSSSPSARQARPIPTRTRASSYGASSSCHRLDALRSVASAERGSPAASWADPSARAAVACRRACRRALPRGRARRRLPGPRPRRRSRSRPRRAPPATGSGPARSASRRSPAGPSSTPPARGPGPGGAAPALGPGVGPIGRPRGTRPPQPRARLVAGAAPPRGSRPRRRPAPAVDGAATPPRVELHRSPRATRRGSA